MRLKVVFVKFEKYGTLSINKKIYFKFFYFLFVGGELYSGTVSDFSGSDALVIRDNLRTEQYDLKHLNCKSIFVVVVTGSVKKAVSE